MLNSMGISDYKRTRLRFGFRLFPAIKSYSCIGHVLHSTLCPLRQPLNYWPYLWVLVRSRKLCETQILAKVTYTWNQMAIQGGSTVLAFIHHFRCIVFFSVNLWHKKCFMSLPCVDCINFN